MPTIDQSPALQQARVLDAASGAPPSNAAPLPKLPAVGAGPAPSSQPQNAPAQGAAPAGDNEPPPDFNDTEEAPPKFDETAPVEDAPKFEDTEPVSQPEPALPSNSAMKAAIHQNMQVYNAANASKSGETAGGEPKGPTEAKSFLEAFEAGLQMSTSGLYIRQKMPGLEVPDHAQRGFEITKQIGMLAGDLPAMVAGGVIGGLESIGTVVGAPAAPLVAAGTAFAIPAMWRKMMIDQYEKGDMKTSGEFVNRLMATTWEGVKGFTTGVATAGMGPIAKTVGGAGAEMISQTAAKAVAPLVSPLTSYAAELATMTTVGAGMESHMPHAEDFINGAIVLGGMHSVGLVGSKLRNIYATTGESPASIVERAQTDVELKQQLLSDDKNSPSQAQPTSLESKLVPVSENAEASEPEQKQMELVPQDKNEELPKAHEIERSDAEKSILSMIGKAEEPAKASLKDRAKAQFDDLYARSIDFLDPLNVANIEARQNGAVIDPSDDSYIKGRLFAAHMDKLRSFLEFGTRDAVTGEQNGEGLNQIIRDIPKAANAEGKMVPDLDGYRAYAIAQRGMELLERGIEPGKKFDPEAAQKVIDAGREKFEPINRRRIDFQNRVLDYAAEKGLFSKEQLEQMKELNSQHVSFSRVMDADEFTGKTPKGSAVKRIEGSEREINDPLLQTYKNTEAIVKRAEINDVRNTFVKNMDAGGLIDRGEEYGNANEKVLKQVPDDDAPSPGYERDNQIAVYEAGKRSVYEGPPGVIDTLKRLDGDRTAMDLTTKIMKGFTTAARLGTVHNPAFAFAHFFRSQLMAGVYSETGMIPFVHSFGALGEYMNKSQDFQDWLFHGGASTSIMSLDETYLKDNKILEADKTAPFIGKAWNAVKTAAEASEAFIKLTDNLSRFSEYKRSRAAGVSPEESAYRSRNVVPDYQQKGLERSMLRTVVAFTGVHINSLDRMAQAFKDDFTGTAMKMSAFTAISAGLWIANKDDEAIDALPDWQKNTYWNINASRTLGLPTGPHGEGSYILRFPKPWAPGILFGSGTEVVLDRFFKDKPNEFEHFAKSVASSVLIDPIPNMLAPVLDQYSNKNAFSGHPLVSEDKEKLLPELQYEPYTSETAKQIAKVIGYVPLVKDIGPNSDRLSSPAVVENYIHGWGGTLGGWALRLSDTGLRAAGVGNPQAHSADTIADAPFFNQFLARYPSMKNQNIEDFYDSKNKTDAVLNSIKYAAKNGDYDAAQAIQQKNPDLEINLDGIAKGIGTAKKTIQNIQDNPNITAVEKRQVIDTILYQVGSMAKMGNKMMSDFQKSIKNKPTPAATEAQGGQ